MCCLRTPRSDLGCGGATFVCSWTNVTNRRRPASLVYKPTKKHPSSTNSRVVRDRWHPWCVRTVWVHQARRSPGSSKTVVRCGLTPDLHARSVEIARMFGGVACRVMPMATAPAVDVTTLRELRIRLMAAHQPSPAFPSPALRLKLSLKLSASRGAHVHDRHAIASGDATDALPTTSPGSVLGGDADRISAAGRTLVGPHAPRARPAAAPRRTRAGGTR